MSIGHDGMMNSRFQYGSLGPNLYIDTIIACEHVNVIAANGSEFCLVNELILD